MPTANVTWGNWVTTTASSTSTYTINVWADWCTTSASTTANYVTYGGRREEPIDRARRRQRELRGQRERLVRHKAATARAQELLAVVLSPAQRDEYDRDKSFTVHTRSGRRFCLRHGWAGNVEELIEGKRVARYCIHPRESVPHEDNLVAQKLMLEHDEDEFFRVANRSLLAVQ